MTAPSQEPLASIITKFDDAKKNLKNNMQYFRTLLNSPVTADDVFNGPQRVAKQAKIDFIYYRDVTTDIEAYARIQYQEPAYSWVVEKQAIIDSLQAILDWLTTTAPTTDGYTDFETMDNNPVTNPDADRLQRVFQPAAVAPLAALIDTLVADLG